MKNILHKFLFLLVTLLCITLIPASTIEAKGIDYPFEISILNDSGEIKDGKFVSHEDIIYISKANIYELANIDSKESNNSITFSRKDGEVASVTFKQDDSYPYDGEIYYPFEKTVTELCLSTKVHKSAATLSVVASKGIWNLNNELYGYYRNGNYRMDEFRNDSIFSNGRLNNEQAKHVMGVLAVGKNIALAPKYITLLADYEAFEDAVQKIMFPNIDASMATTEKYKKVSKGLVIISEGAKSVGDLYNDITEAVDSQQFKWSKGEYKKVSEHWGKFADYPQLMDKAMELFQVEDLTAFYTIMSNVDTIDHSVISSLKNMSVNFDAYHTNKSLSAALNDTLETYNGQNSFVGVVMRELTQGIMNVGADLALNNGADLGVAKLNKIDVKYFDFAKEISDLIFSTDKKSEATWTVNANLVIQDAVSRSISRCIKRVNDASDYDSLSKALKLYRDDMLVYLLAGHNAWKAIEFSDANHSNRVTSEMAKIIQRLIELDNDDFSIHKTSARSHEDLKYFIDSQQVYTFKYDSGAPLKFKVEGKGSDGNSLTEQMFNAYTLSDGTTALRITDGNSSTYISVYDLKGEYEIIIKSGDNAKSVQDYKISLEVDAKPQNLNFKNYLDKDSDGKDIYRIPIPIGRVMTNQQNTNDDDGRYTIFGKWNYYDLAYDVNKVSVTQDIPEEATLTYLSNGMEMLVGSHADYLDYDEVADLIEDYLKRQYNATDIFVSSPKSTTLLNDFEIEYGTITYSESKYPVYFFTPKKVFADRIYGMTTSNVDVSSDTFEDFVKSGVQLLNPEDTMVADNIIEVRTRDHLYHITFDASKVYLEKQTSFGSFAGYPPLPKGKFSHSFDLDNYYGSFNDYYNTMKDIYCVESAEEIYGGTMGQTTNLTLAGYNAYVFDISYYTTKEPDVLFNSKFFYLDLGNGLGITSTEVYAEHFESKGLPFIEFLKSAFLKIEEVK